MRRAVFLVAPKLCLQPARALATIHFGTTNASLANRYSKDVAKIFKRPEWSRRLCPTAPATPYVHLQVDIDTYVDRRSGSALGRDDDDGGRRDSTGQHPPTAAATTESRWRLRCAAALCPLEEVC